MSSSDSSSSLLPPVPQAPSASGSASPADCRDAVAAYVAAYRASSSDVDPVEAGFIVIEIEDAIGASSQSRAPAGWLSYLGSAAGAATRAVTGAVTAATATASAVASAGYGAVQGAIEGGGAAVGLSLLSLPYGALLAYFTALQLKEGDNAVLIRLSKLGKELVNTHETLEFRGIDRTSHEVFALERANYMRLQDDFIPAIVARSSCRPPFTTNH